MIGTPHSFWREMHQSGRVAIMFEMRSWPQAGFSRFNADSAVAGVVALSVVREDIAIRALSPSPPVREVIAAAPAGARLVPAATTMLGVLEQAARRLKHLGPPAI